MRTDIHRPSVINGEEYQWVSFDYYGGSDLGALLCVEAERERFRAHMASSGAKFSGHEHGGICHICGCGNIAYACIFYHEKSNSYIITGQDCAEKLDMSTGDSSAFRRGIKNHLEAIAGKKKAEAFLNAQGLSRAWQFYTDSQRAYGWEENTITDIVYKLVRYGSISEKQTAFLKTLLAKIDNRAVIEAERKRQYDAATPCPTGRIRISGTVLALKVVTGFRGMDTTKILIQADSGFKLWGSRFNNVEKGDSVSFVATIEPSSDDPKFGFFKRPVAKA